MNLKATLHSIRCTRNNSDGRVWLVATFWSQDTGDFTGVGCLDRSTATPGLKMILDGDWETGKHGRQFRWKSCHLDRPLGPAATIAFLRQAPGIGPKTATKLFDRYGQGILELIETPDCQLRVDGVNDDRMEEAMAWWRDALREQSIRLPLESFLFGLGWPPTAVDAILGSGEEDPIGRLQKNPFWACEFAGVGFRRADALRERLHLPESMPTRKLAASRQLFHEASDAVWISEAAAVWSLSEMLKYDDEKTQIFIESLIGDNAIIRHNQHIALKKYAEDERDTCRWLVKRAARIGVNVWPDMSYCSDLSTHQAVQLDHSFKNGSVAVLVGGAGSGKTMAAAAVISQFQPKDVVAVAPTGKAAQRLWQFLRDRNISVRPTTIHSALGATPTTNGWEFQRNKHSPLTARLVVIEEASMLSNDLAKRLFDAIPDDALVLMVGDDCQLPPVGRGALLRDWVHWVSVTGIGTAGQLTEIWRNSGEIVRTGATIRARQPLTLPTVRSLMEINVVPNMQHLAEKSPETQQYFLQNAVTQIQDKRLLLPSGKVASIADLQVIVACNDEEEVGRHAMNRALQDQINPDGGGAHRYFRVGDRVINLRNSLLAAADLDGKSIPGTEEYVANGDMGKVLLSEPKHVVVLFEGRDTGTYVPCGTGKGNLDLGYAITCHRAQGSQWPIVFILASGAYTARQVTNRQWLYTAITRAQELCVLCCSNKVLKSTLSRDAMWNRVSMAQDWFADASLESISPF